MRKIEFGMYLPPALVEDIQPLLDFAFLEPTNSEKYNRYYKSYHEGTKLLDNGFIEYKDKAWDTSSLLAYAEEVEPDQIVAPDSLGNWEYNINQARIMRENGFYTYAVLTGPDWQNQANVAARDANGICLPYRLNRTAVRSLVPVHLLGWRKPEQYLPYLALCKSHVALDTTEPISAAVNNWCYAEKGLASFPRPKNYTELDGHSYSLKLVKENVLWFKEYINYPKW